MPFVRRALSKQLPLLASAALLAVPAWSRAEVVAAPAGVLSGVNSDAPALDTWLRQNVRAGSTAGITATYPRSGDGSAMMTLSDSSGKADWFYAPTGGFGRLADLSALSYDWYRASGFTVAAHLHPVLRLMVDIDGDLGTPNDIAYLVYEQVYNGGAAATTDDWVTASIGPTTRLWVAQPGVGNEEVFDRPLSVYQSTAPNNYVPTSGWSRISGNSLILGLSMGIGSGWAGTFSGAVDNPAITVGRTHYTANFELSARAAAPASVPTLGSGMLAALGAVMGLAGWLGQRRRGRAAA